MEERWDRLQPAGTPAHLYVERATARGRSSHPRGTTAIHSPSIGNMK